MNVSASALNLGTLGNHDGPTQTVPLLGPAGVAALAAVLFLAGWMALRRARDASRVTTV